MPLSEASNLRIFVAGLIIINLRSTLMSLLESVLPITILGSIALLATILCFASRRVFIAVLIATICHVIGVLTRYVYKEDADQLIMNLLISFFAWAPYLLPAPYDWHVTIDLHYLLRGGKYWPMTIVAPPPIAVLLFSRWNSVFNPREPIRSSVAITLMILFMGHFAQYLGVASVRRFPAIKWFFHIRLSPEVDGYRKYSDDEEQGGFLAS
ncbi:hypothetical protein BU24DRAFT_457584 [Aaosphaeria arxii CBS 175.79]|uniref:Uncharacterized protein n=1 Tax=Aaosphaeria arxii CBS 175.79 TaxID=1450172 RepID=A0A6A5Y8H0_9PLEO|nr:uncharacterized protein BU24DRAFT_457584 [Aaosphaeria arxii CBS 175.79]KAF2021616.1 hypothetical protein BU24DRAFT_457584 [Aaosphaeria arxii CBS 175.79]